MIIVIIALLVASFLWAGTTYIDKYLISKIAKNNDFIGSLFIKSFRTAFVDLIKNNGKKVIFFNVLNEVQNSIASGLKVYTLTLAPIAFVTIFQSDFF